MNCGKSILRRIPHSSIFWAVCICFISLGLTALAVLGFLPQDDDSVYYASSRAVIVNINEADISELSLLDGIGYERAEEIVRYRQSHGAFVRAEDIMDVPGIGEGIYRRIRNQIKV